eukprot:Plantae.Rhodophyta-Palmaria_palmata.ctg36295.p1 GENE.Plantae.Rhodophyta-Palmaria_palmata.ctg36295~~Plantae.Rhodophyta-Palmaria_palmata.ctg36295.p1  ORF type:complete len:243 (-),score=37.56 Plantae.Rhodophyta-Palmaria_palmata.ctg36295:11-739(-)
MSWKRMLPSGRREKNLDPEFQKTKTQLANVATALHACLRGLENLSEDYDRLYKGVASFATDFYSLYPSEDNVRRLGKATVTSTDNLLQDVESRPLDDPETASIHTIERQIRGYLLEIQTLQGEMKKVSSARSEWDSAQGRLDRLDARNKADDNKRAYMCDQVEERRVVYETMLQSLQVRLASTYNKHSQVFQAAWTAYILRMEDGKNMLDKHMLSHRAYAKRLEKDVVRMQLGNLDDFDTEN